MVKYQADIQRHSRLDSANIQQHSRLAFAEKSVGPEVFAD